MLPAEPITKILGGTDLQFEAGSKVILTCIVKYVTENPANIQWIHNGEVI